MTGQCTTVTYHTAVQLVHHLSFQVKDDGMKKRFRCKLCDGTFVRRAQLRSHGIHAHTRKFPYVCSLCGLGFLKSKALKRHGQIHIIKMETISKVEVDVEVDVEDARVAFP